MAPNTSTATASRPLCVATVGAPKQGRYLSWRILHLLLKAHGHTRSFMRTSGLINEVQSREFHFPEALEMNSVDMQNRIKDDPSTRQLCCWWPDPDVAHRFDIDIRAVVDGSSLISGTVHLSELDDPRCDGITHKVYLLRDGRDQLVSFAHYMMKEDVRRRWPAARPYKTPREAFDGYFSHVAGLWAQNAEEWLAAQSRPDVLCVRYEELIGDKANTIRRLCTFLDLPVDEELVASICDETSVSKSKAHIPDHVRTARSGDWRDFFTEDDIRHYMRLTGNLLFLTGYEKQRHAAEPTTAQPFSDYDPGRDFVVHMHTVKRELPARKTFIYQPREPLPADSDMEALPLLGSATGSVFRYVGPQPAYVVFPQPDAPKEETVALASKFDDVLRSKHLQSKTVERFGKTWVLHGLANVRHLATLPGMPEADGLLDGMPAVLVSPGPSLSKQLPILREIADRVVIISGTHSLHALRSVGLVPDVLIIADPGNHTRHLEAMPSDGGPRALFISATARPCEFEIPARRRFVFCGNGASDAWMFSDSGEDWTLSTGGSVSCSALSLALRLGCEPVVMIGQDCAISDGRYYAEEALDGGARVETADGGALRISDDGEPLMNLQQGVPLPGYHGGTVTATQSLHAFWSWFEAICEREAREHTIVNATEGGACIRHAIQRPFAEVAAEFSTPLDLDAAFSIDYNPAKRRAYLRNLVRGMSQGATRTIHHAERCLRAMRALFDVQSADEKRMALDRLKAAERELKTHVDQFRLFSLYNHTEILSHEDASRIAPDLDSRLHVAFRSFHFVRRAAEFFSGPLARALLDLRSV